MTEPYDPNPPALPLFPESAGDVLHEILHPKQVPGPPYVHTIVAPPGWEYDDEGEPIRPLFYPLMTVERITQDPMPVWAYPFLTAPADSHLHPLLLNHDIDRGLKQGT